MKVLIACEFSGIVRSAFEKKGHDSWSCDLEPSRLKGNHIQDNVLNHLDKGWDLMIAHPPCTYICRASARWLYKNKKLNMDRYKKGLQAKEFFLKLLNAPIHKIAVENPTPLKTFKLPRHTMSIQPYHFGETFSKKTLFWLKNLPLLKQLNDKPLQKTSYYKQYIIDNNVRGSDRSITSSKVANAMANQWG